MRLLIVADSAPAAEAMRRALRYAPACRVLGWVIPSMSCRRLVEDAQPDVVIVDGSTIDDDLLAFARALRASTPAAKIVLVAERLDGAMLADAASSGFDAAIARKGSAANVGMLIREVAAENVFHFPPSTAATAPTPETTLTARELEILGYVAAGHSNSRIAKEIWVAEQTVKFHLSNIYRKLGVANRTQAAHYAHTHGVVDATNGALRHHRGAHAKVAAA